jgi:hypothetical protein
MRAGQLAVSLHRPASQPGTPAEAEREPRQHHHQNGHAPGPRPARLDERVRELAAQRLEALAEDGSGFLVLACFFGLLLGLALPADSAMPHPWNRVGEVLGPLPSEKVAPSSRRLPSRAHTRTCADLLTLHLRTGRMVVQGLLSAKQRCSGPQLSKAVVGKPGCVVPLCSSAHCPCCSGVVSSLPSVLGHSTLAVQHWQCQYMPWRSAHFRVSCSGPDNTEVAGALGTA